MSYLIISFVSICVAALTLYSGFGLGTLLMPAFALYFPLEIAVAATAIIHLVNNIFKVFLVGKMAHLKTVLYFGLPASVMAMIGAWVLDQFADFEPHVRYSLGSRIYLIEPMKVMLAVLIGFFALFELLPRLRNLAFHPRYIPLGGVLSGFFGGLSGHQGALRSAFLIRSGLDKEAFIGTSTVCGVIVDVSRLLVYGRTVFIKKWDPLQADGTLGLVIVGSLSALMGSFVGARLIHKVTIETVQVLVGILLLIISFGLIAGWI